MDKENTHRQSSELEEKNEEREVTMEREDGREETEETNAREEEHFHHSISYHKFNESQREQAVLKRLQQSEIVTQICDAGTPGISDPDVKLCVDENIPVIPIPGPSALLLHFLPQGWLLTSLHLVIGFLPKHAGSRKERLIVSEKEVATQIFYVPPHKLHQFIEEASSIFGDCRQCAIAREMTKIHEEFWCGTLEEAKGAFLTRQPKGEITFLIEGKANCVVEAPSESQLENELRELISGGQCLSSGHLLVKLEGDIDQGVEYYKKALYYNWHYADAMYNLGVAYGEMLKFDMAIVFYELAFHFNPHCAEACNNLGVIYKDRDNLDKAVECYQLALSIKPNFSQSLNNLGGKMDAAASMIEKAIVANPTYAEAYNNLELKDARIPYKDSPELLGLLLEFSILNAKEKPTMGLSESFLPLFTYLSHEDFKSIVVPSSVKSKFASRASIISAAVAAAGVLLQNFAGLLLLLQCCCEVGCY
ncbi:unnamed protein product [Camellia sinensis]